ncbi:MAG: glycosyltransferase family 9 protein [Bacteroidota bacterium]
MFQALRMKSGLWFVKFHFRNRRDTIQDFTTALSGAERALVLLPNDPTSAKAAEGFLSILGHRFHGSRLTVLLGEQIHSVPQILQTANFIRLYHDAINKFFLPKKQFIEKINQREYDVAIDLNLDLVLPHAYICKVSNARVRVGYVKESSDIFYNFQIKSGGEPSSPYRFLAECLEMF